MRLCSVLLVLAAAGCSSKAASTASTTPANKVADPVASSVDDELAFVPVAVDLVVGVDVARLRRSALWGRYEAQLVEALGPKLGELQRTCGIDPMTAIDRVLVGGTYANNTFSGVIVVRGPAGSKLLDCATKLDPGGQVRVEGGTLSITENSKVIVRARVVGGSTLVVQTGVEVAPAALDATIASGAPLRSSPAFMRLYDRREAGASGWLMISGTSELASDFASVGVKPRSIDGTLTITETLRGVLRVTLPSEQDASQFAGMINSQLGAITQGANGMVMSASVQASGPVTSFDVVMNDQQLQRIAGMVGAMF